VCVFINYPLTVSCSSGWERFTASWLGGVFLSSQKKGRLIMADFERTITDSSFRYVHLEDKSFLRSAFYTKNINWLSVVKTGTAGSVKTGTAGSIKNGTAGSVKTGTAGSVKAGTAGSIKNGTAGSVKTGTAGSVKTGTAGSVKTGTAGSVKTGTAGSVKTSTVGSIIQLKLVLTNILQNADIFFNVTKFVNSLKKDNITDSEGSHINVINSVWRVSFTCRMAGYLSHLCYSIFVQ